MATTDDAINITSAIFMEELTVHATDGAYFALVNKLYNICQHIFRRRVRVSKEAKRRKLVSLPTPVYEETKKMRDELGRMSRRKVTMAETIMRGIECLHDAHYRGAWLSPREAAPVLKQRVNDAVAKTVGQFIIQAMPETPLVSLNINPDTEIMTVTLVGKEPQLLYMGSGSPRRSDLHSPEIVSKNI